MRIYAHLELDGESGAYLRMPTTPESPSLFGQFMGARPAPDRLGPDRLGPGAAPSLPPGLELAGPAPDEVRRWIKAWARALQVKPTELARRAGLAPSTLNRFLAGQDASKKSPKNLSANTLHRLSEVMQDAIGEAFARDTVFDRLGREHEAARDPQYEVRWADVVGVVEAGRIQDSAEWLPGDRTRLAVPIPRLYRGQPVIGLEVRGASMNQVYPHGSVIVCVTLSPIDRPPRHGMRVVVHRKSGRGLEATVMEYRVTGGEEILYPRSDHADHQTPIRLKDADRNTLDLVYVVVGSYRPEKIL